MGCCSPLQSPGDSLGLAFKAMPHLKRNPTPTVCLSGETPPPKAPSSLSAQNASAAHRVLKEASVAQSPALSDTEFVLHHCFARSYSRSQEEGSIFLWEPT